MTQYLYLNVITWPSGTALIEGDRDALVTLRSAINEALAHERGTADVSDKLGNEHQVVVIRVGP